MKRSRSSRRSLVAAAVATMIGLGIWQLQRAEWKQRLLAAYAAAPRPCPNRPGRPCRPMRDALYFRRALGLLRRSRVALARRSPAGTAAAKPAGAHIAACRTGGAEGPGAAGRHAAGRSCQRRAARLARRARCSGMIAPDERSSHPAGRRPGRAAARAERAARRPTTSRTTTCSTPSNGSSSRPRPLVIYWLALRKRTAAAMTRRKVAAGARSAKRRASMMKLTTLANGLRVASRQMPGVETAAVGLYAETGSRHEPARLNGLAHLSSIWCSRARAAARRARSARRSRMSAATSTPRPTATATSFMASVMAEHVPLGVELIADMILRPHFDAERARAREGRRAAGTGRGARHAAATSSSTISSRPPSPTSRSAARCSATRRASPRSASTISTTGAPASIAPAACRWSPPARSIMTRWSISPSAVSATCRRRASRDAEPARFTGGDRVGRSAMATRPISRSASAGAGAARRRLSMPRGCSPTWSAAACRRGCSSSCARSAAWLIRSMPASSALSRRRPVLDLCRDRARASRPPPRS